MEETSEHVGKSDPDETKFEGNQLALTLKPNEIQKTPPAVLYSTKK
jgi:hypothetical protein